MRNLIGLAVALALLSIPGCSRVYGGHAVSVTFSAGYSNYWDDDMDWDNVIMIDDSRIGVWVMLPSGRWVLRCRSIWWDGGCSEWSFGPWWYDYSIVYGTYHVPFHWYMHSYYPRWHDHYFHHRGGHYIRRVDRHPIYREHLSRHAEPAYRYHESPRASVQAVRPEPRDNAPLIQRESPRYNNRYPEPREKAQIQREQPRSSSNYVPPQAQTERTVITRERTITRTDGGDRIQRMDRPDRQTEMTRSRTMTRENSFRPGHMTTRTDSRSREMRRR